MGAARTAITCFNQSPCFPVVPEDVADGPWRKLVGFPLSKCHEAQLFVLNRGQNISWYAMPGAEHWTWVCSCKFDKFMTCLFFYFTTLNWCFKEQHDRLLRCGISLAWRQVTCCFSLNSDKKWIALINAFRQASYSLISTLPRCTAWMFEVTIGTWRRWCVLLAPEDVADGPWRKLVGFPQSKCHEAQLFVLNRGQNISWYAMPGAEHWILVCSCKFDKFMTCWFIFNHPKLMLQGTAW